LPKSWASVQTLSRRRELALVLLLLVPLFALFIAAPSIGQDPRYHGLADTRSAFGIPNFGNVASNLAFLIVGGCGLALWFRARLTGASTAWAVFFAGTGLAAFGSGYYHWEPSNERLAWDRLPMTIAFMGLLTALISEHMNAGLEKILLVPTLLVGVASVVWWRYSGDLRLYAWVQFAPLLAVVFILSMFPARYTHRRYLIYALGWYAVAKLTELADPQIYHVSSGTVSGHTLKHLFAAGAPWTIYLMLRRRRPVAHSAATHQTAPPRLKSDSSAVV